MCMKMHHHCLLCTKNETFCTINIILFIIIIYFNVFASSFVFSIYSYTLDITSCCRIFWVCIVVKCSDSCGGCSCTTDVWACATVSTFATLPSTSGPKPFVPVLCILKSYTTSIWGSMAPSVYTHSADSEVRMPVFNLSSWCPYTSHFMPFCPYFLNCKIIVTVIPTS